MFGSGLRLPAFGWLSLIVAASMWGQEPARKLSKSEAVSAIAFRTTPEYPIVARQLKLEGVAEVEAVIAEDGTVEDVRIVSGNPVLTKSAAQAVRKWKFKPVMEGGKPVRAVAPISLTFKL